jgi:hypothetical protein
MVRSILLGALAGLTWAAALRAFMIELAGISTFTWWGTFGAILLPAGIVGALLAWGYRRRHAGTASLLFLLAPLLLAIIPLAEPGAFERLFTSALGGGALGVTAALISGGFALSGRGPLWARIVVGAVAAALLVGFALTGMLVIGDDLSLGTPRGAWLAVLSVGLILIGMLATAAAVQRDTEPR